MKDRLMLWTADGLLKAVSGALRATGLGSQISTSNVEFWSFPSVCHRDDPEDFIPKGLLSRLTLELVKVAVFPVRVL